MTKLLSSLILSSLVLVVPVTQAQEINSSNIKWILTGTAPSIDKSSANLARGNLETGIRYANKALGYAKNELQTYLARHNLCMAYSIQGDVSAADEHCAWLESQDTPVYSLRQRGKNTYQMSKRGSVPSAEVFTANLAMLNRIPAESIARTGSEVKSGS